MNRNAVLLVTLVLLFSATIPMSVSAEADDSRSTPVVKIGFLYDMSGPIAVFGPGFSAAADIAEDHINAMQSQYIFEIVKADTACAADVADYAAQGLVNDGVVAVAGAACSGASMGANSALSNYGIPQVSYASTSPGLSDDSDFPGFMRVVPSDGQYGQALSYALNQTGSSNPALLYADDLYWLHDSFIDAYGQSNLCGTWNYDANYHTDSDDFSDEVYSIVGDGCDSVAMFTHSIDGAALVEELRDWGFTGSIVGGGDSLNNDGIIGSDWPDEFDYPSEANGVHAVKQVYPGPQTNLQTAFDYECSQDSDCDSGIFTHEAYDSIRIIAQAYVNSSSYSSLEHAILGTGTNWEGASGYVTFLPNGDAVGNGYDICEWVSQSLSCTEVWTPLPTDSDGDGWTDADEIACSTDPYDENSVPIDSDSDDVCDVVDPDDDNDGFSDVDEITNCGENNDPLNPVDTPTDTDGDQICNGLDEDDDNDGYDDGYDAFPLDSTEWDDADGDGIGSNTDTDDDGDGWLDADEVDCLTAPDSAFSIPDDSDGDWICDIVDTDDDNDGYLDTEDWAPFNPSEWTDTDDDGVGDNADDDDDNDDMLDEFDWAPLDSNEWLDTDGDEIGDNADDDDDGDQWSDSDEESCDTDSLDSESIPIDTDGDMICDLVDVDDDDDGVTDASDAFPLDPNETLDTDQDGIGNNADSDDDGDGYSDEDETTNCGSPTDPLDVTSSPEDFDSDLICDLLDEDVDNDGYLDTVDVFPYNLNEWYDNDMDGIGDNADPDDDNDLLSDDLELSIGTDPMNPDTDGDGHLDSVDDLPLDSSEWQDSDGDGTGDNSDAFPSIARYQTAGGMVLDVVFIVVVLGCLGLLVTRFRTLNRSEPGSLIGTPSSTVIPSEPQKVSTWEDLPPGGEYIQTDPMQYACEGSGMWVRQEDGSWIRQ